jgi:hypothetical protein
LGFLSLLQLTIVYFFGDVQLWGARLPRQSQLLTNFVVLLQKLHVLERVDSQLLFKPDIVSEAFGL